MLEVTMTYDTDFQSQAKEDQETHEQQTEVQNGQTEGHFHTRVLPGGKFAALLTLDDGAEELITKFNAVMTETASKILGEKTPENSTMGHLRDPGCVWPKKRSTEKEEYDKMESSRRIHRRLQEDQERHESGKRRLDTKTVHRDRSELQKEQQQWGFPSHERSHTSEAVKSQHRPRQHWKCLTNEQEIM